MFNTILINPLSNLLSLIAPQVGGYGVAIVILTIVIRLLLIPLTLPSMKAAQKMRDLQPEMNELKQKFKNDKAGLQQAQLALFQQHQVNPAAGCLPQILQFVVLIALYQVITRAVGPHTPAHLTQFLWMNITGPDKLFILPIVAALTQFILGLMILPATSTAAEQTLAASTPSKADDKSADDMTAMAATMQNQMVFMMPIMTLFLAFKFPAGLAIYWVVTTLMSIVQQYIVSGWGGLPSNLHRALMWINNKTKTRR